MTCVAVFRVTTELNMDIFIPHYKMATAPFGSKKIHKKNK